jgi:hypothetical protein
MLTLSVQVIVTKAEINESRPPHGILASLALANNDVGRLDVAVDKARSMHNL